MQGSILSDVTVIDMTEGVAGPYAAMVLSDMGANVIKIERPAGDWSRPADHNTVAGAENGQFIALNRNKRNIGLDAASPGGKRILERMIGRADVLISNYRPGVMARLGLGYDECRALNEALIYCTVSGFGQQGAYAESPASDTIIQAMSGVMSVIGEKDGPPMRVGFPLIDMAAANSAVQAILLSLYGRLKGRQGANIDISLMAAALAMMSGVFTRFLASGTVPQRQGNQNPTLAPAGAFLASDGRYISIAVLRDSHWQKFCSAMELEHLADDPRFRINARRVENRKILDEIVVKMIAQQPSAYWLERLGAADILCGPINSFADVVADPALSSQLPFIDPLIPSVPQAVGGPIRMNGTYNKTYRPPPAKGQHTREILSEFGFDDGEILEYLDAAAVFERPEP